MSNIVSMRPGHDRSQRPEEEVDLEKLGELLLYIAQKSRYDRRFGRTKLHKILFNAEFRCFRETGQAITGVRFYKRTNGPLARDVDDVRTRLQEARAAVEEPVTLGDHEQHRLVALRDPDLSRFSAREIAIVDDVLESLWELNAREVSDGSHVHRGWMLVADREEIPYHTALLADGPPDLSDEELAFGERHLASLRAASKG